MKHKLTWLYAAYACLIVGLSFWQYQNYQSSFETVVPYQHSHTTTETAKSSVISTGASVEISHGTTEIIPTETAAPTSEAPETTLTVTETDPTETINYPLDLNTATIMELCTLPGIGQITAKAICDYREQNDGFRNLLQLLEVYGIGEEKFRSIKPYLYLEVEFPWPETEQSDQHPEKLEIQITEEIALPAIPVLNLNKVTKEELMLLPGCTAEIAESILYLRDVQIHIICNPLEIIMAEGVTDELYILWKDYLAVDDEGGTQLPVD